MIRLLATMVTRSLFRSVRVDGIDPDVFRQPTLLVASHFGGFADPVMLLTVVPHTPRFLAKSTLWDAFWLSPLLNMVHAIPIYRAQDGVTRANMDMFTAASQALAEGETVGIYPEGFANDNPGLQPIKTGAARLAIDAHAAGVRGMQIVPICTQYEKKTRMRTRVWLQQGEPIDLDSAIARVASVGRLAEGESVTSEDREAVRAITEMIALRLREIGPAYADAGSAEQLTLAGRVAAERLAGVQEDSYVVETGFANRMARLPAGETERVRNASTSYAAFLDANGLSESQVAAATSSSSASAIAVIASIVAAVLLLPFTIAGAILNVVPWLVVVSGRALRDSPVKEVTINVFVAPIVFPLMWLVWGVIAWANASIWAGFVGLAAGPALGSAALVWWRILQPVSRAQRAAHARRVLSKLGPDPLDARDELRAETDSLLETTS